MVIDRRITFNEDVKNYDTFRPGYCYELFDHIIRYSGLDSTKSALEIGIGTGQATRPILETGCSLTAIELGEELTAFAKDKFCRYEKFMVKNASFEDFEYISNSYDLVYSGTAFHWIPEEIGYPKVYDILKSGGTIALFWNRPSLGKEDSFIFKEIQAVYMKYMPVYKPPVKDMKVVYDKRVETIKKYGFVDLKFKLMHQTRCFSAENYISLLNTYSDHRVLKDEVKIPFESEIKSVIDRFGGKLTIYDSMDLYLARKP